MVNSILITVRTSSTRLPRKAILDINGKPTIQYLIENIKKSRLADKVILCTSEEPDDDILCQIATDCGIDYYRGSLKDKLVRWMETCEEYNIDFFVNVDGDDLFFDYNLADLVIEQHNEHPCDFIDGNGLYNDVYGVSTKALKKVCDIKDTDDTEYIRLYFTETNLFDVKKINNIPEKYIKRKVRMTLDYKEDFEFFKTVIEGVLPNELTLDNINNFLYNNPSIANINYFLDEEWKSNQEKIKNFKVKQHD